ncbi:MAG: trypsin-like peptidase domain-containing protein [Polyangiaceae bacterium]|nr:trypsin-like peptidase domain-containing protein [Polyangiaceae bacterium]
MVVVKAISILLGAVATLVCLASLVGLVFANGWVRLGVAVLSGLLAPALLVDRLLPKDTTKKAEGLVSDVFAVTWLGVPVVYAVLLGGYTEGALRQEGDRLATARLGALARVAYLLGNAEVAWTTPTTRTASASASASAPPSGSASSPATGSAPPGASGNPAPSSDAGVRDAVPADPEDRTPAELFAELAPAVVTIADLVGDQASGSGTGFLIDTQGTVVTNYHVIQQAKALRIKFMNGALYEEVEVLTENVARDLALLRVDLKKPRSGEAPRATPVTLGDSDRVVVGQRAIAIGNPLGLEHTLTDGLVSSRRIYEGNQWLQISVPVSPGNSGGPLFDMRGHVIGVTTAQIGAMFGRAQNLNLAVPVNAVRELIRDSYPGRRRFGPGSGPSSW